MQLDARTVSLTLHPFGDNSQEFNISEVLGLDKVPTNDAQPDIFNEICQQHTHLNEINFPHLDSNEVCFLIRNNNFDLINASLTIKGEDNVPRAKKTALGWTIAGPNAVTASHTSFRAATTTSCNNDDHLSEQRQQIFVAHRVSEILENTQAAQWRHCPGEVNPADDGTRGIPFADFRINCRWFKGPYFLLQPKENWPQQFQPASNTTDMGSIWKRHGNDMGRQRLQ